MKRLTTTLALMLSSNGKSLGKKMFILLFDSIYIKRNLCHMVYFSDFFCRIKFLKSDVLKSDETDTPLASLSSSN